MTPCPIEMPQSVANGIKLILPFRPVFYLFVFLHRIMNTFSVFTGEFSWRMCPLTPKIQANVNAEKHTHW